MRNCGVDTTSSTSTTERAATRIMTFAAARAAPIALTSLGETFTTTHYGAIIAITQLKEEVALMSASSEQDPLTEPARDDLEGKYTQIAPESAEPRTVPGQYTESGGEGTDPSIVGTYIGAEREGSAPLVRSSRMRHGNFPKAEH